MTDTNNDLLILATARAAADWWGSRLMKGDRAAFEAVIERDAVARLSDPRLGWAYYENDYDPRDVLLDAVLAAGLECRGVFFSGRGILPEKHSTRVFPGKIIPKEGYGNWTADIEVGEEPE